MTAATEVYFAKSVCRYRTVRAAGAQDIEPGTNSSAIKEARVLEQSAEACPDYGKAINIKTKRGVIKPRTPNPV